MSNNYYKVGDHSVICDICGKKRKRSDCRMQWDGLLACLITNCWSPKHPNEYPRQVPNDGLPVQDARPRAEAVNWTYLPIQPLTTWEAANWDDPNWRWDDDPSQNALFFNGNP